jgi:hypothetical protein
MSKIRPGIVLPDKYKELAIANRISLKTVYHRIKRGWPVDKAVTTPPSNRGESSRKNGRVHGSIRAGDRSSERVADNFHNVSRLSGFI